MSRVQWTHSTACDSWNLVITKDQIKATPHHTRGKKLFWLNYLVSSFCHLQLKDLWNIKHVFSCERPHNVFRDSRAFENKETKTRKKKKTDKYHINKREGVIDLDGSSNILYPICFLILYFLAKLINAGQKRNKSKGVSPWIFIDS